MEEYSGAKGFLTENDKKKLPYTLLECVFDKNTGEELPSILKNIRQEYIEMLAPILFMQKYLKLDNKLESLRYGHYRRKSSSELEENDNPFEYHYNDEDHSYVTTNKIKIDEKIKSIFIVFKKTGDLIIDNYISNSIIARVYPSYKNKPIIYEEIESCDPIAIGDYYIGIIDYREEHHLYEKPDYIELSFDDIYRFSDSLEITDYLKNGNLQIYINNEIYELLRN